VIDYGFNLQLFSVFAGVFDVLLDGEDFSSQNPTNLNYIEKTYRKRVRGINRFNVFLKVGFLLF
jgi:hypothetical protein